MAYPSTAVRESNLNLATITTAAISSLNGTGSFEVVHPRIGGRVVGYSEPVVDPLAVAAARLKTRSVARSRGRSRQSNRIQRLRVERDRLIRELVLAQQVQRSMLPRQLPELGSVRFGAALCPCEHLAGDFYNVFRLDRDHVGFYLGDVMGHGAAAALLSVYVMQRLCVKRIEGHSYEIVQPGEAFTRLNNELLDAAFPGEPFVTLIYGVLNLADYRWQYSCAGHPPAWLLRGGATIPLDLGGPPLGVLETGYTQSVVTLEPHDQLLLMSDGVDTRVWPGAGGGTQGLLSHLNSASYRDPQTSVDDAIEHSHPVEGLDDDLALMMIAID